MIVKQYKKHQEIINYLIIGVLTTVVSLVIYYALVCTILNPENSLELQVANILAWIGSVLFAYVTNRKFVFQSKSQEVIKEFTSFVGSRFLTLLADMVLMFLGVTLCHFNDKTIKLLSQIIVIVANYILSKCFVFNKKKKNESA